jgi:hypothetical protein
LTIGKPLRADDPRAPGDNGKVVQLPSGAKLKVQEADPYKNLHVPPPSGQYDPRNYSMNQTSSFANKQFSTDTIAVSKNGSNLVHDQGTFATKAYSGLSPVNTTAQNYNAKYSTSPASDTDHADTQFTRNYATSSSSLGQSVASSFSSTSPDQNRTSTLGSKTSKVFASEMSKQYLGPGAQHVPDGFVKENVVMATVKDIPNRPLTIDEVRSLINHGIKPNLDTQPSESSKALNDPNYTPEASPEPPETSRPPVTEDDKNDPLPPPGTMSQPPPENTVPLPQR